MKEEPLSLTKANQRRHLNEGGTTYPKKRLIKSVTFLREEPLTLPRANEGRHFPEGGTTYPNQG